MFTVNIVASCGVEKETHTPFNTKLWSSDFFLGGSFPPTVSFTVLVENGQRSRHVTGRLGCCWFYLLGLVGVEPHVVCSCFWGAVLCPLFLLCDRPLTRCCRRRRSQFVALRSWLLVLWKASLRTTMMIVFEKHPLCVVGLWNLTNIGTFQVWDAANALQGKMPSTQSRRI